ncbi:MAG: Ig-like domain-containing protein [bacterium]|nr:Ig-like domain-containing protein [bacterium]
MLEIGTIPIDFTLDHYASGNDTLLSYSGQTIVLSFIDIDNGWDWLEYLITMNNNLPSPGSMQIIAVIFKFEGSTSKDDIQDRIDGDPNINDADLSFPVLVDNPWGVLSFAYQYLNQGFDDDPDYSGLFSNELLSFMISSDFLVTDKWNKNSTVNSDPISFNKIIIPSVPQFDSQDYDNTEKYIIQRLTNLNATPTILYTTPAEGTVLSGLTPVEVVFSKLMVDAAGTGTNYTPGGAGGAGLTISTASYTGVEKIENVANLTMGGTLAPGNITIAIGAAVTDTEGNPLADNSIEYTAADTDAPVITSFTLVSDNPAITPDITIDIEGSDNVAITHWLVNETATAPEAGDPGWLSTRPTSCTLTSGYGIKEVYAWAKDAAGNVSGVSVNSHFSVNYTGGIPAAPTGLKIVSSE